MIALRTLVEAIVAEPVMARAVIVESPTVGPAMTERYERATKALAPLLRAGPRTTRAAPSFPKRSRTPSPARSSGPRTSA